MTILVFGLLTLVAGPAAAQKGDSFIDVVRQNYKSWDRNGDGQLSAAEVDEGLCDKSATGASAAALAAIHLYQRGQRGGGQTWPAVTLELLTRPEAKGPEERRDQAQKLPHFEQNFRQLNQHLQAAPRVLFAKGGPSLTGFRQGHIGDCFFLATTAAMLHRHPAEFKQIFHPQPDGSCELVFAGGARVRVRPLSDGLITLGSSAGEQGLWLNVLEQGFGQLQLERHKAAGPRSGGMLLALDEISRGGSPLDTIPIYTGHQARRLAIRQNGKAPNPQRAATLGRELAQILEHAAGRRHLVCCGNFAGAHPPGIPADHVFTVLDFDPRQGIVTVRNPWGNQFEPKGPAGVENGYPTRDGVFRVTIPQFLHTFDSVSYETDEPVRK